MYHKFAGCGTCTRLKSSQNDCRCLFHHAVLSYNLCHYHGDQVGTSTSLPPNLVGVIHTIEKKLGTLTETDLLSVHTLVHTYEPDKIQIHLDRAVEIRRFH